MFVSSCTEFRCMCINVSDLVFPLFIVWHRCYGKRLRFLETVCGGENCLVGAINLVVYQSTVPVCVLRRYLGRHGDQ